MTSRPFITSGLFATTAKSLARDIITQWIWKTTLRCLLTFLWLLYVNSGVSDV
ncbi:hypothetical protein DPMN_020407 [Dreissena polymorpha]|uniref:Uncharacterized protein n=1 Tax=Dreissena polymorpha TaxID=45954 RepID=A0A9D4S869_DREPO|nr:hypothetical protein DPMN_020407 [Dreissena polymorpha]